VPFCLPAVAARWKSAARISRGTDAGSFTTSTVIASRALRGRVGHTYGYAGGGRRLFEAGALFAGSRRPQQARIDLMLALGAGVDVRTVFDG